MERSVAIKKLGKLLGKNLGYRVDPKAPTKAERAEARAKLTTATAEYTRIANQRQARYEALLAGDAEYQRLVAESKAARDVKNELLSKLSHYKITVGTTSSMFFHVEAEGDSWEEVIATVTKKRKA